MTAIKDSKIDWLNNNIKTDVVKHQGYTVAQRDALTNVEAGWVIYNTDTLDYQGWDGTQWVNFGGNNPGDGDVTGPASSTDNNLTAFDGTNGKLIKDLGPPVTTTLTDVSNTVASDGQILKWNNANTEWEPSDESGDGDVTGPASSTDDNLVAFDGVTGKAIKDLGPPVTTTLTDISDTAPTNNQVLKYNSGTSLWTPADESGGGGGDGDVTGPASSTDSHITAFDGTTGKLIKDLGPPVTTTLTDVSGTAPTDGQVMKYVSGTSLWTPSDESGNGDVVGPASSTDNNLVAFDGATGKLVKDLGAPVTTTLTDVSNTAPTNNQVLIYNSGSSQYEPGTAGSGAHSVFYDAVVANTGGDYTTVSAAVAAGHTYILVDATLVSPVTETADIVLSNDVYIFIKGSWSLDDYQFDANSVTDLTIRITGENQESSQFTVVPSTVKPIITNRASTSVMLSNISSINASLAGDGAGKWNPDGAYFVQFVYFDCPDSTDCGFNGNDSTDQDVSIIQNCQFNGGGTSCGAVYVPSLNGILKDCLFTGDYYQSPSPSDAIDNKHAIIWDVIIVDNHNLCQNITFQPDTEAQYYSLAIIGDCKEFKMVGNCNIDIITGYNKQTFDGIDFGTFDRGSSPGGRIHCFAEGDNHNISNCVNLGTVTIESGAVPRLWNFSNCQISGGFTLPVQKSTMTNCQASGNVVLSEDKISASNLLVNGTITINGKKECKLIGCTAGLNETSGNTITIATGSTHSIVVGCVMYGSLVDNGTSTQQSSNQEIT